MSTKKITEALTSKKAATASKLFAEEMEARLDELSKKTLGSYVKKAAYDVGEIAKKEERARAARSGLPGTLNFDRKETGEAIWNAVHAFDKEADKHSNKKYKRQSGIHTAIKKLTKEDLDEVEAPANFWNAGMAKMNPIQVSQKQPTEPGQFKATLTKSPKRLADQDSSLEGKPRAVRDETETVAASRGPKTIELTGDWQADVPDHDFDPKLDSETEFYPLFSQFKAMGAYPSGPARAWEETEINESDNDFDYSYRTHPVFTKNFGRNHPAIESSSKHVHHVLKHGDTEHHVRIQHSNDGKSYSAEVYSDAHGQRRSGWDVGKTSHEAFDKAHKAYKENYKMPEYMREDELNEISKKTLGSYLKKASKNIENLQKDEKDWKAIKKIAHERRNYEREKEAKDNITKASSKYVSRIKNIDRATKKLSEDSASLMATATKDEKKAAEQDKKKPVEFKKLHDKHEAEVKSKMKELGEEALDEISDKLSPLKKFKVYTPKYDTHVVVSAKNKKEAHTIAMSKHGSAYEGPNVKITRVLDETLEEGLFDPAKQPLLALWDEHARRADAHGSGSRNEILKRIEDHVSKKYGQEGLKKMHLHSDLTNTLKHSMSPDKGHLQALLGNMRAKCAQGA